MIVSGGYHSGGAAYVLGREALSRYKRGRLNGSVAGCSSDGGHEDVEVAKCLRGQGVYTGEALDKDDRELFHPLPFHDLFIGRVPEWLRSYAENPLKKVRSAIDRWIDECEIRLFSRWFL